jgi:predicted nucleotide-binding protein (sugar kinase/HSP70/actin superfamily)
LTFADGASIFTTPIFFSKEPLKEKKKKKIKRVFKDEWATQYFWAKPMVDLVGKIYMVN